MSRKFLVLLFLYLPAMALDEVSLLSEKKLNESLVIALGTFTPAEKVKNISDQSPYLMQLRELLRCGLRSTGYFTTDGIDSTRLPDMILDVAFNEMEKEGPLFKFSLSMLLKSYRDGEPVLRIKNRYTKYAGGEDDMEKIIDEQGLEIVKYFRERKDKKTVEKPSTTGLTCDELSRAKMVFCLLHTPEARVTANIIGVELQKWTQKRKIPLQKIDYEIDTAFRRIYNGQSEEVTYDALPNEIQSVLVKSGVDYCLVLYDFSSRTPEGKKKKDVSFVRKILTGSSTGSVSGPPPAPVGFHDGIGFYGGAGGSNVEPLTKANQYKTIYCRMSVINVKENRGLVRDDFWADREDCDDEVVQCIVDKVKDVLSEKTGNRGMKKRCWK